MPVLHWQMKDAEPAWSQAGTNGLVVTRGAGGGGGRGRARSRSTQSERATNTRPLAAPPPAPARHSSLLPQNPVKHMATTDVRPRPAQVAQDVGVVQPASSSASASTPRRAGS